MTSIYGGREGIKCYHGHQRGDLIPRCQESPTSGHCQLAPIKFSPLRYSKTTARPVTSLRMCSTWRTQKFARPNAASACRTAIHPCNSAHRPSFFFYFNRNGNEPPRFSQSVSVLRPDAWESVILEQLRTVSPVDRSMSRT